MDHSPQRREGRKDKDDLSQSARRTQRKTNFLYEKSLRRRFFIRTPACGAKRGALGAEREDLMEDDGVGDRTQPGRLCYLLPCFLLPSSISSPFFFRFLFLSGTHWLGRFTNTGTAAPVALVGHGLVFSVIFSSRGWARPFPRFSGTYWPPPAPTPPAGRCSRRSAGYGRS